MDRKARQKPGAERLADLRRRLEELARDLRPEPRKLAPVPLPTGRLPRR